MIAHNCILPVPISISMRIILYTFLEILDNCLFLFFLFDIFYNTKKKVILRQEGSISREILNVNLETLHLASTQFYHLPGLILKQDFLITILCLWLGGAYNKCLIQWKRIVSIISLAYRYFAMTIQYFSIKCFCFILLSLVVLLMGTIIISKVLLKELQRWVLQKVFDICTLTQLCIM